MSEDQLLDEEYGREPIRNVEYAGFWIRVAASLIDVIVLLPLMAIEAYNKISLHSIGIMILITLLSILYKPYLEYTRGATVGKSALGIMVVNEHFQSITLNQSIVRYLPWAISSFASFIIGINYYKGSQYIDSIMEIGMIGKDSFWANFISLYSMVFVVIIIVVAFDKRKQGLHDKIAETYCIKSK